MSDEKRQAGASGLLGDLESIRSLLEESEAHARAGGRRDGPSEQAAASSEGQQEEPPAQPEPPPEPQDLDQDVPLLEDVVHGGVSVSESFVSGEGDFAESAGEPSALDEDIFKALLSDEWRESARDMLDQARAAIERHQTEWTPEHTDELNAALRVRIDETVERWLQEAVASRIDELRQTLLAAVSAQIAETIDAQFNQTSSNEEPDGE